MNIYRVDYIYKGEVKTKDVKAIDLATAFAPFHYSGKDVVKIEKVGNTKLCREPYVKEKSRFSKIMDEFLSFFGGKKR